MKGTGLQWLEQKAIEFKKLKYPNAPIHTIPKSSYSDKDTNSLTKAVVDTFNLCGFFASRIDSKGTYNQHLKRFIPSTQKKGLPDCLAQVKNLPPIWVEIKNEKTKDKIKPHQTAMHETLRASGAIVMVIGNYQTFYEWFTREVLQKQTINK